MKYKGRDVKSSDLAISAAVGGAASYSLTKTLDVVSKGSLHHRNNIISAGLLLGIASLNTAAQQENSDQDETEQEPKAIAFMIGVLAESMADWIIKGMK